MSGQKPLDSIKLRGYNVGRAGNNTSVYRKGRIGMAGVFEEAISKHVIEIRFRPETLSSTLFKHWNISSNRIDFSSGDNPHVKAFFSYRNLGLISAYPNRTAFFAESAGNFIKSAWPRLPNRHFSRIGVRSTVLVEADDFEKAFDAYRKHFLKLSDEDIRKFGGDLVDVGFPMNFADGKNYFNVVTGPMEKEQSKKYFGELDLPSVGVFVDVDYFRKDLPLNIGQGTVVRLLKEGVEKAKGVTTLIVNWVSERS